MKTYLIGRFSIDVPINMKLVDRESKLRLTELREFFWQRNSDRDSIRSEAWNARIAEIKKLRPPADKKMALIETRDFPGLGKWAKGVFYYDNYMLAKEAKWDLLIDYGPIGVWLETDSAIVDPNNINKMVRNITNIANAYQYIPTQSSTHLYPEDAYHLTHGYINLPYRWQETSKTCFYFHPLSLRLEIEMNDTHTEEAPDEGLIGRTTAVITTGYAAGVDIERIRSRKREIAGLKGEEEVDRMTGIDGTELDFGWRYAGEKNSGERPEILITMDSPDGNLDEKLKIWDAILDSLQPMYQMGE